MKITKFLLLFVVAIFAVSCSDDDDNEPALDSKTLSFTENTEVVTVPAAMEASDDSQAQTAVQWVTFTNQMSNFLAFAKVPEGATKSSARITASNGRVKEAGDYVVYTWHDAGSDYTIGYQISETTDSYVFEVFLKLPGQTEWLKYFNAEEKKDKSQGSMKIYNILDGDPSIVWLSYTWVRSGDLLTLTLSEPEYGTIIKCVINQKTKAGSVTYTFDGYKQYEIIWDAVGNGTWKSFDETGAVAEEGSWTV